jgi:hypothetical protein
LSSWCGEDHDESRKKSILTVLFRCKHPMTVPAGATVCREHADSLFFA